MTIVHVTSVHEANDVRIFRKQACSLAKQGHSVKLVASAAHPGRNYINGVEIVTVKRYRRRLWRMLITAPKVVLIAAKLRADIVHFHDPELIPYCLLLRATGVSVVMDVHENYIGVVRDVEWLPVWLRGLACVLVKSTFRLGVRFFDGIVGADPNIVSRLSAGMRQTRAVVVQNFPLIDQRMLGAPISRSRYEHPRLIFLGGISANRCAEEFLIALSGLAVKWEAVVAGNHNNELLLSKLRLYSAWSKVNYRATLDFDAISEELAISSISINLFADQPNHYDVRSNRVFEAMLAGVPVIVSDFPHWRAFIAKYRCGVAVNPHDPKAIGASIKKIIADPSWSAEMGKNGRNAVLNEFSWGIECEKIVSLYDRIESEKALRRNVN